MSRDAGIFELDPMERGQRPRSTHENMDASPEPSSEVNPENSENPQPRSEPVTPTGPGLRPRPSTPCDAPPSSSEQDLKNASGHIGLARLKSCEMRYNFYPAFTMERAMLLDLQAEEVIRLSRTIQLLVQTTKNTLNCEPCNLPTGNPVRQEWISLTTRLEEELTKFETAFIRAKTIDECQSPKHIHLKSIQTWLKEKSESQVTFYSGMQADGFRMIGLNRGPIEMFVKDFAPEKLTSLTEWVTTRASEFLGRAPPPRDDVHLSIYNDAMLSRIHTFVLLAGICVFIVLPLPLMSYFEADGAVRASLVSIMELLVSIVFLVESRDEEHRIVLICAYCAIMGAFLS